MRDLILAFIKYGFDLDEADEIFKTITKLNRQIEKSQGNHYAYIATVLGTLLDSDFKETSKINEFISNIEEERKNGKNK